MRRSGVRATSASRSSSGLPASGHSTAPEEAELRGLADLERSDDLIARLITYWDMQVKTGGEIASFAERAGDILARYGEYSIEGRALLVASPRLEVLIGEIDQLLKGMV